MIITINYIRGIREEYITMIHDFLLLEMYYGQVESALYIEDVIKNHGKASLDNAQKCGHIIARNITIGPDKGRIMCWLSDIGRQKAQNFLCP